MTEEKQDLADGLFGELERYEAAHPPRKDFRPWHRPRKQFVRQRQWIGHVRELLRAHESGESLKYLSLPGVDLLDVRLLHDEVCVANDRPLVFLGFNKDATDGNDAHIELNVSLQEVHNLSCIDRSSKVVADDFRSLASKNSTGIEAAKELGPFDVVNLDLCNGVGREVPGVVGTTMYNAIAQLMQLQSSREQPWLLLITSRIGRNHFNDETLSRMLKAWYRNFDECDGFEQTVLDHLGEDAGRKFRPETCTGASFFHVALGSILKWLLGLAVNNGEGSDVDFVSSMSYRVEPHAEVDDLASFALVVKPVPTAIVDPAGLAQSSDLDGAADECRCALGIAECVAKTIAVDAALANEPAMREMLTHETEQLLAAARFDRAAYRDWVSGK